MSKHLCLLGSSLIALAVPLAAADRAHLTSDPIAGAITVDGRQADWPEGAAPLANQAISLKAVNDGANLYLLVVTSDAARRAQLVREGLIVWFDPEGGTKKRFGVRYPVVESLPQEEGRGRPGGGHRRGGENGPPAEDTYHPADRLDVLGPGKDDARSLTLDHAPGLEAAAALQEGVFVYELKVPLAATSDHPYAIGTAAGKTIGVGLETPKLAKPSPPEGGGGGFGGRGGGHMGGGMGGHGGYGRSSGEHSSFQQAKPLNVWSTVTLSVTRDR